MSTKRLVSFIPFMVDIALIGSEQELIPTQVECEILLKKDATGSSISTVHMFQKQEPHAKATGEVKWFAGDAWRLAKFNAHDDAPGMPSDRGNLYHEVTGEDPDTFIVTLTYVVVGRDWAWFAGAVLEGDGDYADRVGERVLGNVYDALTPRAKWQYGTIMQRELQRGGGQATAIEFEVRASSPAVPHALGDVIPS